MYALSVDANSKTYVSLVNNATLRVVLVTAGPHDGEYKIEVGSTTVAYFSTLQEAEAELDRVAKLIGVIEVEGTA